MSFDLLLEIGTEEIPHAVLTPTLTQLEEKTTQKFADAGIDCENIKIMGTPRRLTILARGLSEKTTEKLIEKKGPAAKAAYDDKGSPTKALQGFLQSNGATIDQTEKREISGNTYIYLSVKEGGKAVKEIIPGVLESLITELSFPKTMKWGSGTFRFVRPISWVLALLNGDVLPLSIGNIQAGNTTFGHRLSVGAITIKNPGDYENALRQKNVMVNPEERKKMILESVEKTAKSLKAKAILSEGLLDTLINLTEFPNIAVGTFEEEFLKLPKEVLISEMIEHQKYIPLENSEGDLLNKFLITANTIPNEIIARGNERVIRARFNDGKFFFDEDRKKKLEEYLPLLSNVIYAKGLGTLSDKVERLQSLIKTLADMLGFQKSLPNALRAGLLAKADLMTGMVGEFPELQGIIGYYYALSAGEPINVAITVKEHYMPKYSGDSLPSLPEGILVSLADRIDNLFAMYSKGNFVTGSKDPFALRRQTLGIIRILIENKLHLDFNALFEAIFPLYKDFLSGDKKDFMAKILDFITTRIKTVFKEYDFSYDEIEAGITRDVSDIYDTYLRISAIHTARMGENFTSLAIAFKRIKNIIRGQKTAKLDEKLLAETAEKNLYKVYAENQKAFQDAMQKRDYKLCVSILTSFRASVDQFFTDVLVMDKDEKIKGNRIALLGEIDALFGDFIDFEKIIEEGNG